MDKLEQAMARATKRRQAARERHREDVEHVQREHPEIADWLTIMVALFGKRNVTYRAVLFTAREEKEMYAEQESGIPIAGEHRGNPNG